MNVKRSGIAGAILATAGAWLLSVALIEGQAPAPEKPVMVEDVFKNVQILKGIPVDEFMGTMGFFSASLGLNCIDCHVEESGGSWERYADDNNLKRTSRRMMTMVQAINQQNFGGRQVVTCNTCHRGNRRPAVMPSLNALYAPPPMDEPGDPFAAAPGQPSAASIFDKYVAAAGGAQRLGAVTTLVGKGTYMAFDDADKSPLELYANSQGQRTTVARPAAGLSTWTLNGPNAWIAAPPTDRPLPLMALVGAERDGLQVEADVFFPLRLRQSLSNVRVGLPAVLENDQEVQVVQGTTAGGEVVTLCFDSKTGLLTRLVRYGGSPIGRLVTRVDYQTYRDVAGVKVPSQWTVAWLSGRSRFELTDVQANVRIDSARFDKPAPPPQQ